MSVDHDERMERELAVRERVRETLAKVDASLAEPYEPPATPWRLPEKPEPVARVAEPAKPAKAAVGVPAVVRAPMPAAKQGNRVWMLASFAPGEEPCWRWVRLPPDDSVIVEALAKAFGEFTGDARREVDGLCEGGDASRHNLVLRAQAAEERLARLEQRLADLEAKR